MPANRQRLKSARVCPSRCECIYNDRPIKKHTSTFLLLVSDRQRRRGESWNCCPLCSFFRHRQRVCCPWRPLSAVDLRVMAACHPPSIVWDHSVVFGPCDRVRIQQLAGESHISHTRATCSLPCWWVSMASLCWNAVGGTCMLRNTSHHGGQQRCESAR